LKPYDKIKKKIDAEAGSMDIATLESQVKQTSTEISVIRNSFEKQLENVMNSVTQLSRQVNSQHVELATQVQQLSDTIARQNAVIAAIQQEFKSNMTALTQAIRELEQLRTQIKQHYDSYTTNSGYVLPRHAYLFTHHSLSQRLQLSYDGMKCWLHSVDEAHQVLLFQENYLCDTSQQVMNLFYSNRQCPESSSSADSTYNPSVLEDATIHTDSTTFCSSASSTDNSDTDSITDSSSLVSSDSNATVYIQSINRYASQVNI
jgi:uncharacterized protein YfcZ (UPF0381/DUF406 family)